jgi:hypothetical protein
MNGLSVESGGRSKRTLNEVQGSFGQLETGLDLLRLDSLEHYYSLSIRGWGRQRK